MKKEILTHKEIIEQTTIDADFLKKIIDRKLIKPLGTVDNNDLVFEKQTIHQIEHITQLLSIGYSYDDIEKILKKVGLPSSPKNNQVDNEKVKYLTVGELAKRLDINPRTIKYWEEKGIIEPDTRSEGGFRLFAEHWIYLCNLIKDLQLFGYSLDEIKEISELFRDFQAIRASLQAFPFETTQAKLTTMREGILLFFNKMSQFKEGVHRWEELLKKKEKEIRQLENKLKQHKTKSTSKEKKS